MAVRNNGKKGPNSPQVDLREINSAAWLNKKSCDSSLLQEFLSGRRSVKSSSDHLIFLFSSLSLSVCSRWTECTQKPIQFQLQCENLTVTSVISSSVYHNLVSHRPFMNSATMWSILFNSNLIRYLLQCAALWRLDDKI